MIALVFLAGCYHHALDLVQELSRHEITIEFLFELDRFIQIMESPIFSCKSLNMSYERSLKKAAAAVQARDLRCSIKVRLTIAKNSA